MKKSIAIIIVIAIIIISIIGVAFLGAVLSSEESTEERLIAIITSDKTITRIGDGFNFSAENSSGDIIKYSWDFGDGEVSSGPETAYTYKECGWHNVTLLIKGESGNEANATLVVGVQREDRFIESQRGRLRDFRYRSGSGYGLWYQIGPNIAQPTVDVQFEIHNAIGNLRFEISVYWRTSDDSHYFEEIYEETYFATVGTVIFDYTVNPNEFPEEMEKYYAEIDAVVWVEEGRWGSVDLTMNVVFPIENL